jgi:hypothetical protein
VTEVPLVLGPAGPHRSQYIVDGGGDGGLERRRPAGPDARGELVRIDVQAQRPEQHQARHLGPGGRIVGDRRLGVGLGAAQQPGRLVRAGRQRDRIAAALAHLGTVGAEQQRRGRKQRVGHREHRAEPVVEAAGDQPGHLDVRQLILADRHQGRLAEQDVRRLVHRVGEHQSADRRLPGVHDLVLDRGVSL